ncbi:hypothetical protein HanIR_Chr13g0637331 [Helianthus annuus]|nr:hypothetical protein HanIR_Chr13g0637331 [Helianthus annuus]
MDTSMEEQWVKGKYGSYARTRTHEVSDSDSLLSTYVEFNIYECGKIMQGLCNE